MYITDGPTDPKTVAGFTNWEEVEAFGGVSKCEHTGSDDECDKKNLQQADYGVDGPAKMVMRRGQPCREWTSSLANFRSSTANIFSYRSSP